MEEKPYRHYDALLGLLGDVGRHLAAVRIAERSLLLMCVVLAVPAAAVLCELAFHPTAPSIATAFHLLLWCMYGTGIAVCLALALRTLARKPRHEQIAIRVENSFPRLRNSLINSVQLGKDDLVRGQPLVGRIISDAFRESQAFDLKESVSKVRLARIGGASLFCAAVFVCLLFGARRSERIANAVDRLLNPFSYTPVVGSVKIAEVEPGDAEVFYGDDLAISATAHTGAEETEGVILYTPEGRAETITRQMSPLSGDAAVRRFAYRINDIRTPFSYRLRIGDSETRAFKVTVARRPEVERVDVAYRFPPYTGLKDLLEKNSRGDIRAVKGTLVVVTVASTRDIAKGHLLVGGDTAVHLKTNENNARAGAAALTVKDDSFYTIHIEDAQGRANKNPISRMIRALPDRKPVIRFTHPGKETTAAPDETVKLAIRAADDYGLDEIAIFFQDSANAPIRRLHDWKDIGRKEFAPTFDWHLDAEKWGPGTKLVYYAEAVDNNEVSAPGRARTPKYTINIERRVEKIAAKQKELGDWERRLVEILKAQRFARTTAADAENADLNGRRGAGADLKLKQADIRGKTIRLAEKMDASESLTRRVREVLFYLTANEMAAAVKEAERLERAADDEQADAALAAVVEDQDAIIAALEKVLGVMPELAEQINKPDLDDGYDMPSDVVEKLKDLADKLKEFAKEQKKVIDATADLAKRPVDDFTEQDEKLLEELAATEEKWSRFMKEVYTDLSKLPVQDFSNPSMLKELVEVQSEVQMAKDALKKKATEIATALEDNGLELAEALTTHIEKWLPDTPDRDQWKMEEALGDYETPMAELPKELEDLIGDLMEEEEDIFDDMEDATSAWADSLDKGAGWDAMDGPIQNMSAQGVTGNRLPNSSEMGGRSGEGRTGKSSGEFVEETATGKGGRKTPTRLTPDPFEQGIVKDTGNEPPGGSTGGGKISGAAQEGMEGPVPPELQLKLKSLAKRQAALRNKAEKISARFQVARWPSLFRETVESLRSIEEDLTQGRYRAALRKRKVVLKGIEDTRRFVNDQVRINRDWSSRLPTQVQKEILDSTDGKPPRGYEDLLKSYYEALSKSE